MGRTLPASFVRGVIADGTSTTGRQGRSPELACAGPNRRGRTLPPRRGRSRSHWRRPLRHGGGAFSGKDPTKVDRSAAYAARWVAKNVVAAGLAERCEIQVAYAIGVAHPVSIVAQTFGTAQVDEEKIEKAIAEVFDLRPAAIIRDLDLRRPIYHKTAAYGHFGRQDADFTWEHPTRVDDLLSAI